MEYDGVHKSPSSNSGFNAPTAPIKIILSKVSSAHTATWSIKLESDDDVFIHAIFRPSFSTRYPAIYAPSLNVVTLQ